MRLWPLLGVALWTACAPALYRLEELPVSTRFGLVVPGGVLLARWQEGAVEITRFRLVPEAPDRFEGLEALGKRLRAQLEGRGFALRCETFNPLPFLGGPQYTLRMARGAEGVGVFLKPLVEPDTYQVEVAPADPMPP
ncbi:MAG: hypothetical protein ABWJ63_09340 [Thermus sp.]|uniref:hypothetical protein n=1 Tax=Thermus sp. TaxID=275 RepID=UPI00351AB8AC